MESRCSQVSNHNILSTQTPGAGWRVGSSGMFRSKPLRNLLQTMEVSTRFAGGSKTGLESLSLSIYSEIEIYYFSAYCYSYIN